VCRLAVFGAIRLQRGRDQLIAELIHADRIAEWVLRASTGPRSIDRGAPAARRYRRSNQPASTGPRSIDRGASAAAIPLPAPAGLQRGRDQLIAELTIAAMRPDQFRIASTGPRSIDRGAFGAGIGIRSYAIASTGPRSIDRGAGGLRGHTGAVIQGFNGAAIN